MITPVLGWVSRIFRAASRPSISGIRMSTSAMSGSSLATRSTSSWPLAASPTTSIPSAMSRYLRSPWRTSEWSSAIATRIVTLLPPDLDGVGPILYGRRPASEDVVPVDGQDREDPEAGRAHDQRRRSWDPEPLEAERQAPEGREQGQDEPGHRHQRTTREDEGQRDQQGAPQVDAVGGPQAHERVDRRDQHRDHDQPVDQPVAAVELVEVAERVGRAVRQGRPRPRERALPVRLERQRGEPLARSEPPEAEVGEQPAARGGRREEPGPRRSAPFDALVQRLDHQRRRDHDPDAPGEGRQRPGGARDRPSPPAGTPERRDGQEEEQRLAVGHEEEVRGREDAHQEHGGTRGALGQLGRGEEIGDDEAAPEGGVRHDRRGGEGVAPERERESSDRERVEREERRAPIPEPIALLGDLQEPQRVEPFPRRERVLPSRVERVDMAERREQGDADHADHEHRDPEPDEREQTEADGSEDALTPSLVTDRAGDGRRRVGRQTGTSTRASVRSGRGRSGRGIGSPARIHPITQTTRTAAL